MENKDEINSGLENRVNLNRRSNFMYDIKAPQQKVNEPTPTFREPLNYERDNTEIEKKTINSLPSKPNHKKLYIFLTITLIIALIAIGAAYYFYYQNKSTTNSNGNEDYINSINEIRKVALLPEVENSNATLSVVLDPEEAKNDPNPSFKFFNFFENAEAGDYLLHYPSIGKYVLFRPGTHQIINMLTIPPSVLNPDEASPSLSTTTSTSSNTIKSR